MTHRKFSQETVALLIVSVDMCKRGILSETEAARFAGVSFRTILRRLPAGFCWGKARADYAQRQHDRRVKRRRLGRSDE